MFLWNVGKCLPDCLISIPKDSAPQNVFLCLQWYHRHGGNLHYSLWQQFVKKYVLTYYGICYTITIKVLKTLTYMDVHSKLSGRYWYSALLKNIHNLKAWLSTAWRATKKAYIFVTKYFKFWWYHGGDCEDYGILGYDAGCVILQRGTNISQKDGGSRFLWNVGTYVLALHSRGF